MIEEDIKALLEQNIALTKEVRELSAKTAKYIRWGRVLDGLKLLLILLPLIAAWLYLPDIIGMLSSGYGDLLPAGLLR